MSSRKSNALKRPRHSKQPGLVNCMGRPASMCRYIKTRTYAPKVNKNPILLVLDYDISGAPVDGTYTFYNNKFIDTDSGGSSTTVIIENLVIIPNTSVTFDDPLFNASIRYFFGVDKCVTSGEVDVGGGFIPDGNSYQCL